MKRPSRKEIKARVDALKGKTEKHEDNDNNSSASGQGKLTPKHSTQRIRKKGAS